MSEAPASSAELPQAVDAAVTPVVEASAAVSAAVEGVEAASAVLETPETGGEGAADAEGAANASEHEEKPAEAGAGEEKPAEGAEAVEAGKEGEGAKPDASVEAKVPTYAEFKLPEGMTMEAAQTSAFGNILGKYGLSQEAGQEIMDFGAGVLKQAQERMAEAQVDAFAETRRGWVKDFESMAGNRRNTMLNDAKAAIKDAVPDDKARAELWNVLAFTGAGDHPAVIKAFAAIGKRARERGAPSPAVPAKQQTTSPADRRYGRSN